MIKFNIPHSENKYTFQNAKYYINRVANVRHSHVILTIRNTHIFVDFNNTEHTHFQ